MTKSTKEVASIAQAELRLAEAQAQLVAVESEAAQAAQVAKEMLERVGNGDTTITVDDLVRAAPEAERRAAIVPYYRKAVAAADSALRKVRTDEMVRSIETGSAGLLTYEQVQAKVEPYVQEIANVIGRLERELSVSADAHSVVFAALASTTAFGPRNLFPNGVSDSPLQVNKSMYDRTLSVNGVDYHDIRPETSSAGALDRVPAELARRRNQKSTDQ